MILERGIGFSRGQMFEGHSQLDPSTERSFEETSPMLNSELNYL